MILYHIIHQKHEPAPSMQAHTLNWRVNSRIMVTPYLWNRLDPESWPFIYAIYFYFIYLSLWYRDVFMTLWEINGTYNLQWPRTYHIIH